MNGPCSEDLTNLKAEICNRFIYFFEFIYYQIQFILVVSHGSTYMWDMLTHHMTFVDNEKMFQKQIIAHKSFKPIECVFAAN